MTRSGTTRRKAASSRRSDKKATSLACLAAAVAASQSSAVEAAASSKSSIHVAKPFRRASNVPEWATATTEPRQERRPAYLELRGGGDASDNAADGHDASAHRRDKGKSHEAQPTKPRRRRSSKSQKDERDGNHSSSDSTSQPSASDNRSAEKSGPSAAPREERPGYSSSSPSRVVQEILRSDDYYEILGLSRQQVRDAPDPLHVVTKAYRRRCVHTHPDKTGGDRSAFDKVAEAYHVLSDEAQRKIYDKYGKRGLQQHQQAGGGGGGGGFGFGGGQGLSAEDLFRSFFEGSMGGGGGGGGFFRSQQQSQAPVRRNRTTRYQLEVTLADLYKGMSRSIRIAPPRPTPFFQPRERRRPDGDDNGDDESSTKVVNVRVPRGTLEGAALVLSGEIDFDRDAPPADLVLIVKQVPHPVFQRKNYDLITTVKIPLSEALCGFSNLSIPHVSGETLVVSYGDESEGGEFRAIRSGDVHVLKGHGMPKDESGRHFGDLYVVYQVEMPPTPSESSRRSRTLGGRGSLSNDERRELKRLLSKLEGTDQPSSSTVPGSDAGSGSAHVLPLQRASAADVGRASGQPPPPSSEPHLDDDHDHEPNGGPFGSRFFFSSGSAAAGPGPSFFGMPGFDVPPEDGDADGVQCRQM